MTTLDIEENVGKLVEYIATTLSRKPDAVKVETYLEDLELEVNLVVDQMDMGRVIGRQGRVAHAIRALAKAAHTDPRLHVILNIDSWQEIGEDSGNPDTSHEDEVENDLEQDSEEE